MATGAPGCGRPLAGPHRPASSILRVRWLEASSGCGPPARWTGGTGSRPSQQHQGEQDEAGAAGLEQGPSRRRSAGSGRPGPRPPRAQAGPGRPLLVRPWPEDVTAAGRRRPQVRRGRRFCDGRRTGRRRRCGHGHGRGDPLGDPVRSARAPLAAARPVPPGPARPAAVVRAPAWRGPAWTQPARSPSAGSGRPRQRWPVRGGGATPPAAGGMITAAMMASAVSTPSAGLGGLVRGQADRDPAHRPVRSRLDPAAGADPAAARPARAGAVPPVDAEAVAWAAFRSRSLSQAIPSPGPGLLRLAAGHRAVERGAELVTTARGTGRPAAA